MSEHDNLMSGSVSHYCVARLVAHKLRAGRPPAAMRVPVEFRYTAVDPWAIEVHFGRKNCWRFARSLLDTGRVEPVGEGLVRVMPLVGMWVEITSRASGLAVLLSVDRGDIDAALDASEQLVPLGAEDGHVDLDAELARWIAPGRTP